MRASHLATALTAFAAGLSAATVLNARRAERHRPAAPVLAAPPAAPPATAPAVPTPSLPAAPGTDGVVLPFLRTVPTPPAPAAGRPARCGDSGGLTRAGAPCGARATSGGRCHHHPLAA
ncbi:hypothetical protein [Trujillonella humicola]|uniref:hypothetical protein n=1 Tax=Trujillonella humicola TaxID=3383699 RepID=UPI0039063EB9